MALCVILCRAGLGVNISVLKNIKFQVFKLAFLPVTMEAISFSIVNKFILNMPFEWSFLLWYVSSAPINYHYLYVLLRFYFYLDLWSLEFRLLLLFCICLIFKKKKLELTKEFLLYLLHPHVLIT